MKGVEGWGAQRSDFFFRLKTTQGEINNRERKRVKTKRKVLSLGLAEKRFFSLVTILTSNAEARNANPRRTSLALGFHSFPQRREKAAHCVSPPTDREGQKKKKKSLFLNFQRTEITQRKQKQGWSEIILKLNIRFFFLDIKKIWEFQKFSEFPMTKQMPCGLWIMLKCSPLLWLLLVPSFRKSARLQHSEKSTSLPFPQNPSPNFFSQTCFQFQPCLFPNARQIS